MGIKLPIMVENSRVPRWLSKISPIDIGAISIVFFVFARGRFTERTKRHETIHFRQWMELAVIGFAVLYPMFFLVNLVKYRNSGRAYRMIMFEREAYAHEDDAAYLRTRKAFAWLRC
jgi:hypothetical protein